MGNIFSSAKSVKTDKVEDDFVGGGGVLDTDIYSGSIKYMYLGKAANSDARSVTISVTLKGNKEVRETIWMTNRDGDVTYKDKRSGEMKNLPGFNQVNALCMMLTGKEIGELETEEKVLNLYDFEAKKEVPQSVECFTDLHGVDLQVAVQRVTVDKEKKDDNGKYQPTGETRDQNEFVKFFPADKRVTMSEIANFISSMGSDLDEVMADGDLDKAIARMDDEGPYAKTWLEKNQGQTYNKAKGAAKEGKAFGGGSSGGGEKKAKKSLFD